MGSKNVIYCDLCEKIINKGFSLGSDLSYVSEGTDGNHSVQKVDILFKAGDYCESCFGERILGGQDISDAMSNFFSAVFNATKPTQEEISDKLEKALSEISNNWSLFGSDLKKKFKDVFNNADPKNKKDNENNVENN